MQTASKERRALTPAPDWLLGCVVRFQGLQSPKIVCRQCSEILCIIEQNDSLWIFADVARDHRQFCRDNEERGS